MKYSPIIWWNSPIGKIRNKYYITQLTFSFFPSMSKKMVLVGSIDDAFPILDSMKLINKKPLHKNLYIIICPKIHYWFPFQGTTWSQRCHWVLSLNHFCSTTAASMIDSNSCPLIIIYFNVCKQRYYRHLKRINRSLAKFHLCVHQVSPASDANCC